MGSSGSCYCLLHIPAGLDKGVKGSRAELPEELKAEASNLELILDSSFPSEIQGQKVLTVLLEYRQKTRATEF
jgi:hypothetical protein